MLGRGRITMQQLIELQPGDILPCDFTGRATVLAEDVPIFRGTFGVSHGQQAVQIEERVSRSQTEDPRQPAGPQSPDRCHRIRHEQSQRSRKRAPPSSATCRTSGAARRARDVNLEVILDVPVTLSMEVGRTRIPIRNLLQLNQGSVVELDRAAGEPLDVFVNGTLVAHGEVVVVNEKFGIRLTDVISPAERIRKLK